MFRWTFFQTIFNGRGGSEPPVSLLPVLEFDSPLGELLIMPGGVAEIYDEYGDKRGVNLSTFNTWTCVKKQTQAAGGDSEAAPGAQG